MVKQHIEKLITFHNRNAQKTADFANKQNRSIDGI